MRRENLKARLLRALSGKSQADAAKDAGVDPALVAQLEKGNGVPKEEYLEGLARGADLTPADAEEILRLAETLRRSRRWQGKASRQVFQELAERVRSHAAASHRRLLILSRTGSPPGPGERRRAEELLARLKPLPAEWRLLAVRMAEEYQSPALRERARAEAKAAGDPAEAAGWERLAEEIAGLVP